MSLEEDVIGVICERIGVQKSQVKKTSMINEELGTDSLDIIDIIMAIDEKYGIKIEYKKVKKIKTVDDLIEIIRAELSIKKD